MDNERAASDGIRAAGDRRPPDARSSTPDPPPDARSGTPDAPSGDAPPNGPSPGDVTTSSPARRSAPPDTPSTEAPTAAPGGPGRRPETPSEGRRLSLPFGPSVPAAWQRALCIPLVILAWLAVIVVVGWLLSYVTRTLVVVGLSGVLAFAFSPLANRLARMMPRPIALGLAYVLGVGVVVGCGVFVVSTAVAQITSLVANLPKYAQQAQDFVSGIAGYLAPFGVPASAVNDVQQQVLSQLQSTGTAIARQSLASVEAIAGGLIDLILILILSVYLAANGERIAHWLRTETPKSQRYRAQLLVAVINRVVGGYVRGIVTLAALIGVLVGAGLTVLGVPYAMLLGVLAFFMTFVPIVGTIISGVASGIVAILYFQNWFQPLLVIVYFIVVHVIEGDLVGPRIMGRAVGIHPATGMIALVAGTELFGLWGALFAAPIAGLVQAIATAVWHELRGSDPQKILEEVTEEGKREGREGDRRRAWRRAGRKVGRKVGKWAGRRSGT
ncbi:MAG: AI-2E family transporter [Chloroflexi bacterium]|nr:AI-2E family transporter [Chloroflexota bacterium]